MGAPLTSKQHVLAILSLGLPLVGGHLAQFSIHVTDTLMLGWYSVEALAAVVLGGSFFSTLLLVGFGFGWAVMPVISAYAATGQDAQVRRVTRMGMWLSFIFAALVMPLFWYSESLLLGMGQNPEISASAADYLRIAGWGLFPALQVGVLRAYLAGLEKIRAVFWITVVTAFLNAGLNYALIFGNFGMPELGVKGAAIGSITVQFAGLVAVAIYVGIATPEHAIFQRFWRPDWEAFGQVFNLGWPIGLTSLAETGLFTATSIMMGWVGTLQLAAHGIAIQLISAIFMLHVGIANVATIRAGKAFGRRDAVDLRGGAKVSLAMALVVAFVTVLFFLLMPEFLLGLFIDPADPARGQVIAAGVGLLMVAALFQVADAGQVVTLGLLRGVQQTRAPMIYAAISYWLVGIPVSYVLGFTFDMGGVGIWLGLVFGLSIAWVTMSVRFWGAGVKI